ncbi:MAG: AMP-binding protein, partial [Geobacteraceae bacterium]|nr:AMP-binding protein [Geobacteraceae bacterium]
MSKNLEITIGGLLDQMAERFPDNDALVYVDRGLRYSYYEFNQVCRRVAKGLMKLGVRKGDHVSIWATNVPEWVILSSAAAKIGAVLVTVNTSYRTSELEYILKQSDSGYLFLIKGFKDIDYMETLYEVVPELRNSTPGTLRSELLPFLKHVVYIGEETPSGTINFNDLYEMADDVSDDELEEIQRSLDIHDVINMQYTSGTTGFPKGVMLTHYNLTNNGFYIGECMKFTEKDRLCIPVPFFHCFGSVLAVMASVTHGATMVPIVTFNPLQVLQAIEQERCTAVHGVPTMFIAELEHPDFDKFDLTTLRTGIMAGSVCPIE